jgi:hypothetical protein
MGEINKFGDYEILTYFKVLSQHSSEGTHGMYV